MKAVRVLCLLVAFLLLAFPVFAQEIHTHYDHNANFAKYHTYSWLKVNSDNSLWAQRIEQDVNNALQKLGLKKVPSGGDLSLTAVDMIQNQQGYQTFCNGMDAGWWWGGFGPTTTTTTPVDYRVGTLVVDMYDSSNHPLVWRGTATGSLSNDPSSNREKLQNAVNDMIQPDKFPKPVGKLST